MAKPTIFFYITQQGDNGGGTGWYRMYEPAMMIKELGLANVIVNPFNATKRLKNDWLDLDPDEKGIPKNSNDMHRALSKSDVVIFQRYDTAGMFALSQAIKKIYRIPVLQETDDYVWDVPANNPGAMSYHEKRVENFGNPDEPMNISRISMGTFDGYVVSTKFLENLYKNYAPTFHCPNSVDFTKRKPKERKGHSDIRIMFSSSAGHMDGLKMIEGAVQRILKKYPEATFYQYGKLPMIGKGPQYKKMKWVAPHKYWEYINSLEPDICLAPVRDRLFNRAKSNLRLLEYWTSGPNPVIASPVENYKNTIKDGVSGLFAKEEDEWVEKIEDLIKNPKKRESLAKKGLETAKKDYDLRKNARNWVNAAEQSIDSYDPNRQPPKEYLPPGFA
jgi:glycosyltransferase involved in cell wall biosynthesis